MFKGQVIEFISAVKNAIDENTFVKMTLGKYRGKEELQKIYIKPVELKGEKMYSFTYSYKTKEEVKNLRKQKAVDEIADRTGGDFLSATLFTKDKEINIEFNKKRESKLKVSSAAKPAVNGLKHNRDKNYIIEKSEEFLKYVNITNDEGEVKKDMYDKFRQVNKFTEIVKSLYKESELKNKDELKIIDAGSGKSYLTFSVYHLFKNVLGKVAAVKGIEQRKELAEKSNKAAKLAGFDNLEFVNAELSSAENENCNILIALHACDTATDDAIAYGIRNKAEIIITAPCCQKYVRKNVKIPEDMQPMLKHGIMLERFASNLTDALRGLVLEQHGYKVKIFEFISSEHTDKNILISAVKGKNNEQGALIKMNSLKEKFSLNDFYLDRIMSI